MKKVFTNLCISIIGISSSSFAQLQVHQPEGAYELLQVQTSIDNSFSLYKNYSLQIAQKDNKDEAKVTYDQFKINHPWIEVTIIKTDNLYKIFVGNFKNKIEAYQLHRKLKREYPSNFMVLLGPSK